VWEGFSYLGPDECNWVLENHPDKLPLIADAALYLVPNKAIPLLQINNVNVDQAKAGDLVGIKVSDRVRRGDTVYKVTD